MKKFLTLFVLVCPLLALAQQTRQITGQVLDRADGAPLVGATVFIAPEETQAKDYNPQGTIAYEQGRFAFKLPASVRKVVVSYLGYEARTLDISGKSDFTIYLSASDNKVDAVVVTGYQRIEKRKLTSSISSVKMSDIARDGVASVDEMLSGSIAGLVSTPTSGGPGAASKIKIRSTVTLNGNTDPLWVLDGMPLEGNDIPKDWSSKESVDNLYNMSIAGLNPWDIEDITVLKDAAATAIYGARAANGVIGNDNKLIWHLPDDLKMFKSRTMGRPIIMGRKTFESLPKVLPGRVHYVLTGNRAYSVPEGVYVFHTVKELLSALPEGENFIIGGEKMYEAMFPYADKMYITEIEKEYDGDAVFPSFRKEEWKETESVMGKGDPVHRFVTYKRVRG